MRTKKVQVKGKKNVMPAKRKQPHLGAAMGKPKGLLHRSNIGHYTEKK